ncbi:MAG: signal peptidase I [Archaeoglobaceae archaeon]
MLTFVALIAFTATHFIPGEFSFYAKIPFGIFLAISAIYEAKNRSLNILQTPMRLRSFQNPEQLALYVATLQIVIMVCLGIFLGFGKSPYSFTPIGITTNLLYVLSTVIGFEFSRAYVAKSMKRKLKENSVLITATIYFFILVMPYLLNLPKKPTDQLKFLGNVVIPIYTQQLFASLLVYIYGARGSIAFFLPITAFEWFSPILPNIDWTLNALVTTAMPAIGYSILEKEKEVKKVEIKKESPASWIAFMIIALLTFLFFTGSFGVHPAVIGSGSMSPSIETGDVIIVLKTNPDNLNIGDVIQYMADGYTVTHRIIDVYDTENGRFFITKGDANEIPDDPVSADRVIGKVVFVIPKVGLFPLGLKKLLELWGVLK